MEKRHRIFIAINLPSDVKRELFKYSEKWTEVPAKWIEKENLHITLEFMGDLTDQETADVCLAVNEVAKNHNSFNISLNTVGYGPNNKNPLPTGRQTPKFVWVAGEKSDELISLRKDLQERLLEKVTFRPEERGFAPHVTLARIKETEWRMIEPEERPEVFEEIGLTFTAESIEVMESELKRKGPIYTILESCPFGNN